jgi:oligopeptidase B
MDKPFSPGPTPAPPRAEVRPSRIVQHGRSRVDDYAWLRAANWKEVLSNPVSLPSDIEAHLRGENAYCNSMLADTESLQQTLIDEMKGRLPPVDMPAWTRDGPFEYGRQHAHDAEYPQLVRRPVGGGSHSVMVDLAVEAEGHSYFRSGCSVHAPTHRMLAWFVDDVGAERLTIRFRDLETGRDLIERISNAAAGGAFSRDGRFFLYIRLDDYNRKSRLYVHRLGQPAAQDVLLLEERDPMFALNLRLTQSRTWFVVSSQSHEKNEVHLIPAADPFMPALQVHPRQSGSICHIDEGNGLLYAMTNSEGSHDYKIATARVDGGQVLGWHDLVGHESGTTVVGHRVFRRHLAWLERRGGVVRAMVRRHADGRVRAIPLGDATCALDFGATHEFDTGLVRLVYSSMRTPPTVFDADMDTGTLTRVWVQSIGGGFDENLYITKHTHAISDDGVRVPVSLVARRDTRLNGTAPCLLYGYGAYGVSLPAHFDADRLGLLNRGFVWAIAHVRGGGELGAQWHDAGKGQHKLNGVRDFLAAARMLVNEGYTAPGRIVAHGVSAGGALVGAALNTSPETFAAIVVEAPFVDVLNTMSDATLPLTPLEWPEWGDPIGSAQACEQLANWSPYENVTAQSYPSVLAMQALADPRVTYWEAAKWTARLRAHQLSQAPILLKIRIDAGHGGASGRQDRLADAALRHAFVLRAVGCASPMHHPST